MSRDLVAEDSSVEWREYQNVPLLPAGAMLLLLLAIGIFLGGADDA